MVNTETGLKLSVLVTVVSGEKAVRRCLKVLAAQINFADSEIIVPFDQWSAAVGELAGEFPGVRFHFVEDLGLAKDVGISAFEHRLYDRRRAVGLKISRGRIIAMTEDHAIPAEDWCERILEAHEQPHEVIGGAIENAIDRPLNWAWYYCDFGRYGRPLQNLETEYISDINVAYKRSALESVRDVWQEAYHETTVHRALRNRGVKLYLNDKMIVFQNRPPLSIRKIWRERRDWGRVFAETRVTEMNLFNRLTYAAGTILLPPILLARAVKNMRRQKRTGRQIRSAIPYLLFLLIGWSVGECAGYLLGEPLMKTDYLKISAHDNLVSDSFQK